MIALAWMCIVVVLVHGSSDGAVPALSEELVVLCLVALAASAVMCERGDAEPGGWVAPGILLLGLGMMIAEAVLRVSLFVPTTGAGAASRQLVWAGVGLLALALLRAASSDPARR